MQFVRIWPARLTRYSRPLATQRSQWSIKATTTTTAAASVDFATQMARLVAEDQG